MTDSQDYGQPRPPQYDPRQHQQRVQAQHRVQAQPPAQYPPQGYGQVQPYAPPPYQGYAPPQSPYQGYAPPAPPYPAYPGYPPYGQPQYAPQVAPKSTAAGLILGLLWPGVGCMYAGRIGIGILIMAIWLISIPLMFVGIGFVTGFCAWVASAALGYGLTREWNAKHGIVS
jgi:TM2 domain-containing membrane protein YozV